MTWTPDSWRTRPATQQAQYPDDGALRTVVEQIRRLPPLVTSAVAKRASPRAPAPKPSPPRPDPPPATTPKKPSMY
jgi:hypothetical protein